MYFLDKTAGYETELIHSVLHFLKGGWRDYFWTVQDI
jgi:hypothetical protein